MPDPLPVGHGIQRQVNACIKEAHQMVLTITINLVSDRSSMEVECQDCDTVVVWAFENRNVPLDYAQRVIHHLGGEEYPRAV